MAAAAAAGRSPAAMWGETRNNHGPVNKYRQTRPKHHPWEDAFTVSLFSGECLWLELSAGADHRAGRVEHDLRGAHAQLSLVNVNDHQCLLAEKSSVCPGMCWVRPGSQTPSCHVPYEAADYMLINPSPASFPHCLPLENSFGIPVFQMAASLYTRPCFPSSNSFSHISLDSFLTSYWVITPVT